MSEPKYPDTNVQILYAEGAASLWYGGSVVKIYLSRYDPDIATAAGTRDTTVAQLVMPTAGFAATAVFFEKMLKQMVENKTIPAEVVAGLRAQAGLPQ